MKKSRVVLIAVILGVHGFSYAQNLVPNYSLEDTTQCTNSNFDQCVTYWSGGGGGLCYFSSNFLNNPYGIVPQNVNGYQYAHSGVAYAGIYTYIKTISEERGYIQDSLISPLIGGTRYYVTFYVSLADSEKYACNNIGAYFSSAATIFTSGYLIPDIPQISNDTAHNPLTDKINWMKVSGSFVAAGGEQYIVIGNFVDDAHVDTVFVNSSASSANVWTNSYYYIDDVIVSTDSTYADSLFTGVNEIKPVKASVKVYPNPANNILNVSIAISKGTAGFTICLYNSEGGRVMCETLLNDISTFSINQLSSGIYYYRIMDGTGNLVKADKIIITH